MRWRVGSNVVVGVVLGLAGCVSRPPEPDAGPRDVFTRELADVGADVRPDVPPVEPCGPAPCGPEELCGRTRDGGVGPGNGMDDDCDGLVDETCYCEAGEAENCFPGPADRRGVGPCSAGRAVCREDGTWGDCTRAVVASPEQCNGVDDNCDGMTDEGLTGCAQTLACPAQVAAQPLSTLVFDGTMIRADARGFQWSIECPDTVRTCPPVAAPNASTLTYLLLQSGTYRAHVAITLADGTVETCVFPVFARGAGLRMELDWDTKGGVGSAGVDLDLHLVAMDPRGPARTWFSLDDCYYTTCLAPGGRVNWRLDPADTRFAPTGDLSVCEEAPAPFGALWRGAGHCWNPRLDTDTVACDPAVPDPGDPAFCHVENLNVDVAPDDVVFRAGVNFYKDHGTCADADPSNDVAFLRLAIYCGGDLRGYLGDTDVLPVTMPCARNQALGSSNWTWLAADVQFGTNACGVRDCRVWPLRVAPSVFPYCDAVDLAGPEDRCQDGDGNVFVRRNGQRPVDADLARSF